MKPKYHFFNNAKYAFSGIKAMLKSEISFRIELCIILPAIIVSLFLPVEFWAHLLLIIVLLMILIVECVNSAIEACVDLVTDEFHQKAKIAKDCASAAVFFSIILAVGVWIFVLISLWVK